MCGALRGCAGRCESRCACAAAVPVCAGETRGRQPGSVPNAGARHRGQPAADDLGAVDQAKDPHDEHGLRRHDQGLPPARLRVWGCWWSEWAECASSLRVHIVCCGRARNRFYFFPETAAEVRFFWDRPERKALRRFGTTLVSRIRAGAPQGCQSLRLSRMCNPAWRCRSFTSRSGCTLLGSSPWSRSFSPKRR